MTIGDRIKKRRKELGLTQAELAEMCGYKTKASINKVETSIHLPHLKIEELAKALKCDPSYLMGWEDENGIKRTLSDGTALEDVRLLTLFSQLNKKNQDIVVNLIHSLLDSQK